MKKIIKILSPLLVIMFYTCDDVLEEDISDDNIEIIAPTNNTVIEGNNVQFSWQHLDGADDYRIQISGNNQVTILDSLVSINQFNYNLNEGNYQWRVKGENFAYETEYTFPVDFTVEVSEDLSNQNVVLATPSDNLYTNDSDITLTWNTLSSADSYTLEILKINNGETTIYQESNITGTSISTNPTLLDEDAEYIWKVKAVNSLSETPFSERTLFLDRAIPGVPTLNSPDDNSTNEFTVTFNWSNGVDTGNIQSAIISTIEIATDINFNTLLTSNQTDNNSYQYTFANIGNFYWRVKASDMAGNQSENSITRTITIE